MKIETLHLLLIELEEKYSNKIAFRYVDEDERVQEISTEEFINDVKKAAVYFEKIEDKFVGLLAHNSYESIVLWFGIMLANKTLVTLNVLESKDVIDYQINKIGMSLVIDNPKDYLDSIPMDSESQLNDFANRDVDATRLIIFTSGTTGKSKGVQLSERNMFSPLKKFWPDRNREDLSDLAALLVVPIYHISGVVMLLPWVAAGATVNIVQSPMYVYRDLGLMKSDFTFVVPSILKSFHKDLKRGRKANLGSLSTILCGGAPVDSELFTVFQENGINIVQAYALTETCGKGTINYSKDASKVSSIGLPDPEANLQIIDGEICFTGAPITKGYFEEPDANADAFTGDIFHTGDLGYIDEDGYVYITGRKKNLIILSGGENVNPEELEEKMATCMAVKECIVFEEEDKIHGEIYCLANKQDEIKAFVKELNKSMPGYKKITKLHFREVPFEKTVSGKIKRI